MDTRKKKQTYNSFLDPSLPFKDQIDHILSERCGERTDLANQTSTYQTSITNAKDMQTLLFILNDIKTNYPTFDKRIITKTLDKIDAINNRDNVLNTKITRYENYQYLVECAYTIFKYAADRGIAKGHNYLQMINMANETIETFKSIAIRTFELAKEKEVATFNICNCFMTGANNYSYTFKYAEDAFNHALTLEGADSNTYIYNSIIKAYGRSLDHDTFNSMKTLFEMRKNKLDIENCNNIILSAGGKFCSTNDYYIEWFQLAVDAYQVAIKNIIDDTYIHTSMIEVAGRNFETFYLAEEAYENAIKNDQDNAYTYNSMMTAANKYPEKRSLAIDIFNKAKAKGRVNDITYRILIDVYVRLQDYDKATQLYYTNPYPLLLKVQGNQIDLHGFSYGMAYIGLIEWLKKATLPLEKIAFIHGNTQSEEDAVRNALSDFMIYCEKYSKNYDFSLTADIKNKGLSLFTFKQKPKQAQSLPAQPKDFVQTKSASHQSNFHEANCDGNDNKHNFTIWEKPSVNSINKDNQEKETQIGKQPLQTQSFSNPGVAVRRDKEWDAQRNDKQPAVTLSQPTRANTCAAEKKGEKEVKVVRYRELLMRPYRDLWDKQPSDKSNNVEPPQANFMRPAEPPKKVASSQPNYMNPFREESWKVPAVNPNKPNSNPNNPNNNVNTDNNTNNSNWAPPKSWRK